nr:hypothetical protein CFP56_23234 [Quercus suber]
MRERALSSISESSVRSREEDEELQRSTKKVKENLCGGSPRQALSLNSDGGEWSYREKLVGATPGVFEHGCNFENVMEAEAVSDDEFEDLPPGEAVVHLSGNRKNQIRATWANALIVKVFGKTVGFHFL